MAEIEIILLKPHSENHDWFGDPKDVDFQNLKEDIKTNGILNELHITPDYLILCGHLRHRVAKELGMKTVPCKTVNIKGEEAIAAYIIKENLLRRHLTTEQKYKLYAELSKVYERGNLRRGIYGRGRPKLEDDSVASSNDVLERTAKDLGIPKRTIARARQYDEATAKYPEFKKHTVNVALKKYKLEKDKERRTKEAKGLPKLENLILGDCLEELPKLPVKSVDCVIIDPPYGLDVHVSRQQVQHFEDGYEYANTLLDQTCEKIKPILKDDTFLVVFAGPYIKDNYSFYQTLCKHFGMENVQPEPLIWVKNNHRKCDYSKWFARKYEPMFFVRLGTKRLNNPVSPDILEFDGVSGPQMAAEKPVKLLEYLIENLTVKGETILDCFAGTGSTLIAAKNTERKWIGIEKDHKYYEIARRRLNGK